MQRVPGQFAAQLGGEEGVATGDDRAVVLLLVSPFGKVWRAELRLVGGGGAGSSWQLGGAWAEFAATHGIGAGWSVVPWCSGWSGAGWPRLRRSTRPAASRGSARLTQVNITGHVIFKSANSC
jgi:hypothetical protein